MVTTKKITDPWHHSQSWAAHGHHWQFTYNSFTANYTIENGDRTLSLNVPIRETDHHPSPQAWLDHWAKTKGKRQLKSSTQESQQPSLLESLPHGTISKKSPVTGEISTGDFEDKSPSRPKHKDDDSLEIIHLDLEEIRRDGGTQPRAKIDLQHIKRLEQQMEDGQELEPIVVFYDGESYWLADGFHRWNAHRNQEEPTIRAIIHQGSRRQAVLYSVGANTDHKPALPRSRADKRKAVLTLLEDPQWKQWSDRQIARVCKVDHKTVGKIRKSLTGEIPSNKTLQSLTGDFPSDPSTSLTAEVPSDEDEAINEDLRTYRTKHGTIATMNTANIGVTQEEDIDKIIKVTTDEILIAFSSNLENFSDEQLKFIGRAIAGLPPERVQTVLRLISEG